MNCDFRLFGLFPGGYVQYPDDYTSAIFSSDAYRLNDASQLVIVREGHMAYYNYYRKLNGTTNGKSNYLGMSVCFNGVFCNKPTALFDIFEQLIIKLAADGSIICQARNGGYYANTSVLYDKVADIDKIVGSLEQLLDELPQDSVRDIPSLNYGIGEGQVKELPLEYADLILSDAISRSNRLLIRKNNVPVPVAEPVSNPEPVDEPDIREYQAPVKPAPVYHPQSNKGNKPLITLLVILLLAIPILLFILIGQTISGNGGRKSQPSVYVNGYEFVDLGLSVLWATRNVGSTSASDRGNYYAWGEYRPKPEPKYSHSNYRFCLGVNNEFTKYVPYGMYEYSSYYNPDGKVELEPEDDAAQKNWGYPCRLPTRSEFNELVNNCSHRWVTKYGVSGMEFTGRNGNSIFMPAAGFFKSSEMRDVGVKGFYMSSTLNQDQPNSFYRLCFYDNDAGANYHNGRVYGHSVRAVVDRKKAK